MYIRQTQTEKKQHFKILRIALKLIKELEFRRGRLYQVKYSVRILGSMEFYIVM